MLDVGCGEGRFCRMLGAEGIACTGVDPTRALIERARELDPGGAYFEASGDTLPAEDASFDLVTSYLSLLDMPEIQHANRGDVARAEARRHAVDRQLQQLQHSRRRNRLGARLRWRVEALSGRPLSATSAASGPSGAASASSIITARSARTCASFCSHGLELRFFDEPAAYCRSAGSRRRSVIDARRGLLSWNGGSPPRPSLRARQPPKRQIHGHVGQRFWSDGALRDCTRCASS
jgi:SAM-dependent methyltransferase